MHSEPVQSQTASAIGSTASVLQKDIQLIQIVDNALADATRRAGAHLACRPGCTQCCHGAFAINPLDALRLRTAMADLALTQPEQAAAIAERAQQYLSEFGPSFPGNPTTGILDTSPEAEAAFEDFANDAPCPALNPANGLCDLYEARPMTCRVFGPPVRSNSAADGEEGFAVCELCFTEATPEEIAGAEMIVPHAEEECLLEEMNQQRSAGDTIVAFCLVSQFPFSPGSTAS
jgi:Fe-S-cluster containining protein